MLSINNLLLKETNVFLNYTFNLNELSLVQLPKTYANNFWSFITNQKEYVVGDIIYDDYNITSLSNRHYTNILKETTFFIDDNIWYDKNKKIISIIKHTTKLYNSQKINHNDFFSLLKRFNYTDVQIEVFLNKKYNELTPIEQVYAKLLFVNLVNKKYNFFYIEQYHDISGNDKKFIKDKLNEIAKDASKAIILVYTPQTQTETTNDKDTKYTSSKALIINENEFNEFKKINHFKTFFKMSSVTMNMYKWFWTPLIIIIFITLLISLVFLYNSTWIDNKILNQAQKDTIIFVNFLLTFVSMIILAALLLIRFKTYYRYFKCYQVLKNIKLANFCFLYILVINAIVLFANITALIINAPINPIFLSSKYTEQCILINVVLILFSIAITSIWILFYNNLK